MKYIRRAELVDAIQWLPTNHDQTISWAAGKAYFDPFSNSLEVNVNGKIKRANSGDYLVKNASGVVDTIPQSQFEETYERYIEHSGPIGGHE